MTDCREYEEWKKKNPNWKPFSCYNCGQPGHISRRETEQWRKRQRRVLSDLDFAIELYHVKNLVRKKPDIIEQPGVCD